MIDLMMLYAFILVMAVAQYAINRWRMSRGLAIAFTLYRTSGKLSTVFESSFREYLITMIWTFLNILIVTIAGFRLFALIGMLNFESGLLLLIFAIYFAKDLIHYATANFVMQRVSA